jgi:hypothetical protein
MYSDTADGEDDAEQWIAWMSAIHAHFSDNSFTVKQLAEAMSNLYSGAIKDDAPYSLGEIGKANDRAWLTRLGCALHNRVGQMFSVGDENTPRAVKLIRCMVDGHKKQKGYRLVQPR